MSPAGNPAPGADPVADPVADSWWGRAWVRALEESALDPGRLARGRAYARAGHVEAVTVAPGRISAAVRGSRPRPYRAGLRLPELTDQEWDAFLAAVAAQPAHLTALLDNDMPHGLAGAARTAGVRLLPDSGELAAHCTCPDRGDPCKHAAALCYRTARLLDADPFLLLLLRGRGEDELLDELGRRNARLAAAASAAPAADPAVRGLPGVAARRALATSYRPPLPEPLPPPPAPGGPPPLPEPAAVPGDSGHPDADALDFLATDTAARAHAALTGATTVGDAAPEAFPQLSVAHDAVRLAATHPHLTGRRTFGALFARLAERTGRSTTELARAAAAWRQGGAAGLAVLEADWDPPAGDFDRARGVLAAAGFAPMSIRRNRLTSGSTQLRYGRDGRWYPYRTDPHRTDPGRDDWWPEGPAAADPVGALTGGPPK